jgi:hypothetical protein
MADSKPLWHGKFNWHGQVLEDWTRAESKAQAFVFMTARLGVEVGTTSYAVRNYFAGKETQKYTIEEVQEK